MKVDTWHTTHPLDEERFHKALNDCFQRAGKPIDFDSFKDAMTGLAKRLYPNMGREYLQATIERYAQNAEVISGYLSDVGGFDE